MIKRICCWLCALIMTVSLLGTVEVMAFPPMEVEHPCSLTLHFTQNGIGFYQLEVRIYRVAEAFANGAFGLITPFSNYPVNIHGITSQTEWKTIANTLSAYVTADQIQPTGTQITSEEGTAVFTQLKTGLYLVSGAVAQHESGTYIFDSFMVYLPTPQDDGSLSYDVQAKPKCSNYTPATEYKVVKLWKDSGNEDKRPESVTVDILKDGVVQETQVLNAENNWTYTWRTNDENSTWSVVEKDVPDTYTVTIDFNTDTFMITNTRNAPIDIPQTGDTSNPWLYMIVMCLSGVALLILGIGGRRGRKNEQKA